MSKQKSSKKHRKHKLYVKTQICSFFKKCHMRLFPISDWQKELPTFKAWEEECASKAELINGIIWTDIKTTPKL